MPRTVINMMHRLLVFGLVLSLTALAAAAPIELRIDTTKTHQTIEGFGASGAWCGPVVGSWDDTKRKQVLKLLFDDQQGAGLSIYRYHLAAGGGQEQRDDWRRAPLIEVAPGQFDASRDLGIRFAIEASRAGAERLVAFACTPPGRLSRNGLTRVDRGVKQSNLAPENYRPYAEYLCDAVAYLQQQGMSIDAFSPVNEPQWAWDNGLGEGLHLKPAELAAFVRVFVQVAERRMPRMELELFESGSWRNRDVQPYLKPLLANQRVLAATHSVALHSYWSNNQDRREFINWWRRQPHQKPLRMTEFCQMQGGRAAGIGSACELADTIIADLTICDVVSWSWWLAVSNNDFRDGLIQSNDDGSWIEPNKRLWALAHFGRFIETGSQRIEASCGELPVVATRSPDANRVVATIVNAGNESITVQLPDGIAEVWRTSKTLDCERVKDEVASRRLPARSVTTFVITHG